MYTARKGQTWLKWFLIGCTWILFAVFFASEGIAGRAFTTQPLMLKESLAAWLICASLWFLLTPLVLWLAHHFPLERETLRRNLFVHLGLGAIVALSQLTLYVLFKYLFDLYPAKLSFAQAFGSQFIMSIHADYLTYWAIVGLNQAHDYYKRYRERELRAAQLEATLTRAQLDALKMQLHPHFLFNTLNSISVLMAEDVKSARRMLTNLSDLLRASFENVGSHEVSLREELEFLRNYLAIEQTRFQDRLTVRFEIDPETLEAVVPNLILQPLVENAIRHGVAPLPGSGIVEIRSTRRNGLVELKVIDNGPGLKDALPANTQKGIGLANTKSRLRQLYGDSHDISLDNQASGGLMVTVVIPYRSVADDLTETGS